MLARTPSKLSRLPAPAVKQLNRNRKETIREKIADIARIAEPTPFAVEGPCKAGIRASLCLQGWKWADADAAAAEIVTGALNVVGAERPTWEQGQPEYTQPGALPIQREYCARCGKKLPEGHRMWCGDVCARAANNDRVAMRMDEEGRARRRAQQAATEAKWQERQPTQECEGCGLMFKPKSRRGQRFCRIECTGIVRRSKKLKTRFAAGVAKASTPPSRIRSFVAPIAE